MFSVALSLVLSFLSRSLSIHPYNFSALPFVVLCYGSSSHPPSFTPAWPTYCIDSTWAPVRFAFVPSLYFLFRAWFLPHFLFPQSQRINAHVRFSFRKPLISSSPVPLRSISSLHFYSTCHRDQLERSHN